ncbi:hypothetical protein HPP92_015536 [Vanilla planifolia]|uniref:ENTH domain-containing protein n=1 Tax=Vanilla planifolia TaxID=51239 RepID=A0A835QD70_VANPL|nr:hypothetical protein HPP92_016199 [Vanilla planifolia]KAG0470990.1 hypothetical protein HPP92_015536 [Vanilla planifolia]
MPSKLRRAICAIKDQTSLGLARVSGSSVVAIAVVRATSHDEHPADEGCIAEILLLACSSPEHSAAVTSVLSRRLSRTRNWVVAVKSLCFVSRAISECASHFLLEALSASNAGDGEDRLLDLSSFRDESGISSPWDFTAFVRTFALYLDSRLNVVYAGDLQRRSHRRYISDLKPSALLDRIRQWRFLLDRAMGTRPTGSARSHHLVRTAFASVVCESFDLYRDISDALSLLLDSFFHLPGDLLCSETFRHCAAAAKQFDELESFYAGCKKMGIGRHSEYPTIRKISDSLLQTLQEFVKGGEKKHTSKLSPAALPQYPSTSGDSSVLEKESWELALLESVNELSATSLPGSKASALGAQSNKSPTNKKGLIASFQNPFLHAAYDKSLMAVTSSPSGFRTPPSEKELSASRSVVERFISTNYREKKTAEQEKEEDPFDLLARRERPALISLAAKEFREKYYRQAH